MYVSSTVSWVAHIVVILCVIRWSGSYANLQNLREKNDTTKLFPSDRRHVVSSNSELQPILEKHQLPKLEIGRARLNKDGTSGTTGNGSVSTVGHKREKRCLLTLMAAGAVASAASWFIPPPPPRPPPPKIVWVKPSPKPVWRPPPPPKPVWRPPLPPPKPVQRPPPPPPKQVWRKPNPVYRPPLPKPKPKPVFRPPGPKIPTTTTPKPAKVLKTTNSCATEWGSCVVQGKPHYSTTTATFIMMVVQRFVKNMWVLEFVHPETLVKITIPRDVGDDYIVIETQQYFTIFVDRQNRTYFIYEGIVKQPGSSASTDMAKPEKTVYIVTNINTNINIIVNYNKILSTLSDKKVGRLVIGGVPEFNDKNAIFIMKVTKMIVNGIWVIEFVHPPTRWKVQVPENVGDEYVVEATRQVFKIFVDKDGRTYLIYKSTVKVKQGSRLPPGAPSVDGVPHANMSYAVKIDKTVQRIVAGILMIEFAHPTTWEIIQVPFNVGDVHVDLKTRKVYLIYVLRRGQTLLVLKGMLMPDPGSSPGTVVVDGKPEYNLKNAIKVFDTVQKVGLDRRPVIEFVHPYTKQIIQIPVDVGQTHVDATGKVYVIFEDAQGRTLLIFKCLRDSKDEIMKETIVGTIVVKGQPKYDISKAIIVIETTWKVRPDGTEVIEFLHPITRQPAQIPANVGDEYLNPTTRRIFVILVDDAGRTLLIFKGWKDRKDPPTMVSAGSLVVDGVPIYDVATAIIIRDTVKKVGVEGWVIIEFVYPGARQKVRIPLDVGDEHTIEDTGEVFKIFVDVFGRTYLILKARRDRNPLHGVRLVYRGIPKYDVSKAIFVENTELALNFNGTVVVVFKHPKSGHRVELPYDLGDVYVKPGTTRVYKICVDGAGRTLLVFRGPEQEKKVHWITVVKKGVPVYDISKAIYVMKTEIMLERDNNVVRKIVEFQHPITLVVLRVATAGADRYTKPGTKQRFLICVDNKQRTLLIFLGEKLGSGQPDSPADLDESMENIDGNNTIIGGTNGPNKLDNNKKPLWGSIVVEGKPKYDIKTAIYITNTVKKMTPNGVWVIEFVHPDTKETIQVPFKGADEYVERATGRVFIICVDRQGKTILVFKGYEKDLDPTKGTATVTPTNTPWGSIVVDGKPKYDIKTAIYVTNTVKKMTPNGVWVIEFVHPDTKETIQVPFKGADEYVERATGRVFIICVDRQGKTILVFKGYDKDLDPTKGTSTVTPTNTAWGSVVVDGKPKYDIQSAIYVTKTKKKMTPNGVWVIEFVHPDTKETIQIPDKGGDEYVERATGRVFIICVDRRGKTLLVLKNDASTNTPGDGNVTALVTIVVDGKPKYDIPNAIYIMETEKKKDPNGVWVIEFVHPDTKKIIRVPFDGADEYVVRKSQKVFIICVDRRMKTLLVFKGYLKDLKPSKEISTVKPTDISRVNIVINGKPKYDIATAIYITKTEKIMTPNGVWVIVFVHPDTKETIQVPLKGADEYVERATGRVFIICVDRRGKTILILKEGNASGSNTSWGSIVVNGKPKYDIANAIYVLRTVKRKTSNGVWVIEFDHPDTEETIQVPFKGGDEYIERETRRVFIICVDRRMKTILVFKGRDPLKPKKPPIVDSGESDEDDSSTINENYNSNTNINKILHLK